MVIDFTLCLYLKLIIIRVGRRSNFQIDVPWYNMNKVRVSASDLVRTSDIKEFKGFVCIIPVESALNIVLLQTCSTSRAV